MSSMAGPSTKSPITQVEPNEPAKDDSLPGLAKNRERQKIVPESNAVEAVRTKGMIYNEDDNRADTWDKKQKPESEGLRYFAFMFLFICRSRRVLWFSDKSLDESSHDRMEATLNEKWPQTLGSINGEATKSNLWNFEDVDQKLKPPSDFELSMRRYDYEEGDKGVKIVSSQLGSFETSRGNILAMQRPKKPVPSGTLILLNPDISYHCLTVKHIAFLMIHLGTTFENHALHISLLEYYLNPRGTVAKLWASLPDGGEFWQTFGIRFFARVELIDVVRLARTKAGFPKIVNGDIDTRLAATREFGRLSDTVYSAEKRVVIIIRSQFNSGTPCFNIIQIGRGNASLDTSDGTENRTDSGGPCGGMRVFLDLLASELVDVCHQWGKVLDGMDEKLGATVTNLLDEKTGHELMFDDNEFKRSKLYFTLQQLCRMFSRCVEETQTDLEVMREDFFKQWYLERYGTGMKDDLRNLEGYWDKVMEKPIKKLKSISARIKNKQEDVESLRDGLFNATSVREASRGLEIN